jgi:nucleotide-binding universal stress UspA family protein
MQTHGRNMQVPPVAFPEQAPLRSLLVPIDLTPSSDRVLGRLAHLPLADHARITVLHVVPRGLTASEQRRAERDAIRTMAEEVRHQRKALPASVRLEPLVKVGAAARAIISYATKTKTELVVMGRGSRNLRDDMIGSTAERVIRQARVPILVVRLAPRSRYKRPAIALADDDAAIEAVAVMLRVLAPPRPAITVIHAFDAPYRRYLYPSLSEDEAEERMDELQRKATRTIASLLRKALAKAKVRSENAPTWKPHYRFDSPRIVIERAAKKNNSDLLVLGTHGHSGLPYLFLGTVAGDVLRQSTCDVLMVPPARLTEE